MHNTRKFKVYCLAIKTILEEILINRSKKDLIYLLYYRIRNWGDAINPIFTSMLTSKKIVKLDIDAVRILHSLYNNKIKYLGIGSIIEHADENTIIWGSGLQGKKILTRSPLKIHAVRGPLTAKALKYSGINCPNIYGDPGLLFPLFYKPKKIVKKYKLGIACHISDVNNNNIVTFKKNKEIKIISMRKTSLELIDDINECENIISTSLHGLILGDAYQIPTFWGKISDKIPGKDFKFHDYHASLGLEIAKPLIINDKINLNDMIKKCTKREVNLDLQKLLESSPYKH